LRIIDITGAFVQPISDISAGFADQAISSGQLGCRVCRVAHGKLHVAIKVHAVSSY
jgi:hypothetical protein